MSKLRELLDLMKELRELKQERLPIERSGGHFFFTSATAEAFKKWNARREYLEQRINGVRSEFMWPDALKIRPFELPYNIGIKPPPPTKISVV